MPSVRVDRRRQHILHDPSAQLKNHLRFAWIALDGPRYFVCDQIRWRVEKQFATIFTTDNLRRRLHQIIKVDAQLRKDQFGERDVINIDRTGARYTVKQPNIMRWIFFKNCSAACGLDRARCCHRACAGPLDPAGIGTKY